MRFAPRSLLGVVGAAGLSGCELIAGPVCTLELRPAIFVAVWDASTNAPAAAGATIVARDGAFADTVMVVGDVEDEGPFGLAAERSGVYTVTVEREGYEGWQRSGVLVTRDECHVRTVQLEARLQPSDAAA